MQPKVLAVETSNLQDKFNDTKACLRVFLASFPKTRWPPRQFHSNFRDFCCPSISKGMQCTLSKFAGYVHHGQTFLGNYSGYLDKKNKMAAVGVSLTVFLQNTKRVNISKTVRDRAISSEFLTHRVVQEYSAAI